MRLLKVDSYPSRLFRELRLQCLLFCGDKSFSPVKFLEHVIVAHTRNFDE
jgi:hypothetical protein